MSNDRWDFFKDGDTSFGLFYPRHYSLAGYADAGRAERGAEALRRAGFAADDVRVVSGRFLTDRLTSQDGASLLDRAKASVAEFIGTETYFIDQDVALAGRGGAFVFVYTPEEADGERVKTALASEPPVHARRYLSLAIDRLVDPHDTRTPLPGTR
jgi:hypothetical protein